ncbi:MAG: serine/threonine-protein kinase, partial [Planctomycetota bacterium]
MSTAATIKIAPGYEPITGYVLEKPIGRGGYGEVWQCNAPGGLKKAVKFVFGGSDDTRGSRELKSLERIKGVHHPFLLTLERFGVVDDRLVIVTELADGSLEDIYNRHRDRGSCGIPRKALLKYLHDAADALDYLHSRFQLQHLDIKPGNLLLVGGHVKVGDFGLLKDLREADCSVVGGLTPLYAPPELFDGKPSLNSDQYSLAVMYQELLTGSRPFSGRTIAQLATQHVHGTPDLNPLPAADRPIVARALEKNPE